MPTKEVILNKIQTLITKQFNSPEDAFNFFDANGSGTLTKKEISKLLKQAKINGLIRGIVADKLIEGYDTNGDKTVNWQEFKAAVNEITANNTNV